VIIKKKYHQCHNYRSHIQENNLPLPFLYCPHSSDLYTKNNNSDILISLSYCIIFRFDRKTMKKNVIRLNVTTTKVTVTRSRTVLTSFIAKNSSDQVPDRSQSLTKMRNLCRVSHSILQRMLSLQKARHNIYKTNNGKPFIAHSKTILNIT